MTFLLNSTSNLSSGGWKLLAEGINGSCYVKARTGRGVGVWGGEEAGGRKAGWGLFLQRRIRSLGKPWLLPEALGWRAPVFPLRVHQGR